MRVLTFGWDYPPVKNGGLGVACQGLTEELLRLGVEVIFVLPHAQELCFPGKYIFADTERLTLRPVHTPLVPYSSADTLLHHVVTGKDGEKTVHARVLLDEVQRYAKRAAVIAAEEEFDVIHAHDWVSYLAGCAAKEVSGKPLILHVHATSFDQAASEHIDPRVFDIEKDAFEYADTIITVSQFTKDILEDKHGVHANKVVVVHNGVADEVIHTHTPAFDELKKEGKKIVLYHGRITIQKGPDYFVRVARRVVDTNPNVLFVISGWGDMEQQILHMVGGMGLGSHVLFAGSLWGDERDRMYQTADIVVMPSVSEPFGLVPLEALRQGTPVLISKQSGVAEVLPNALRVDFWDVEEMANKIIAALRYPVLHTQLAAYGKEDTYRLSWHSAAEKVKDIYHTVIKKFST